MINIADDDGDPFLVPGIRCDVCLKDIVHDGVAIYPAKRPNPALGKLVIHAHGSTICRPAAFTDAEARWGAELTWSPLQAWLDQLKYNSTRGEA